MHFVVILLFFYLGLFQSVRKAFNSVHAQVRCAPGCNRRPAAGVLVFPRYPAAKVRKGCQVFNQCHAEQLIPEKRWFQADDGAV
jgi:hypothetical protein